MISLATDTSHMLARQLRKQGRLRMWWVIMVSAPLCWLLLYGQLFDRVIRIPGGQHTSYVAFLAPGLVVMTAFSWSLWSGMTIVRDVDRGLVESFLATPMRPVALVLANVVRWMLVSVLQTTIIIAAGAWVGFHIASGPAGWLVLYAAAALTAGGSAAASNAIALLVLQEETLSAILSFLSLPLMFLSAALIAPAVMPAWMRDAVAFNPIEWGVVAARGAAAADPDWALVALKLGQLAGFSVAAVLGAVGALRAYRRTL